MEPILAYRGWRLTIAHQLRSVVFGDLWEPGAPATVTLQPGPCNQIKPCNLCQLQLNETTNGYHAFKTLTYAEDWAVSNSSVAIIGGVYLWGNVETHALGYRASNAYPAWVIAWCGTCKQITTDAKLVDGWHKLTVCRKCLPSRAHDTYDIGAEVSRVYGL